MSESTQFIKFMVDIIESGTWARLSVSARTLYPVLLKFSDQNFKHVWPSTPTLLELTGFKTKKSIIEAKKDLIKNGLIQTIPGSGHSNSLYYFSFNYAGSKITPLWDKKVYHRGGNSDSTGVESSSSQGDTTVNPNQINITITNNQNQKPPKQRKNERVENPESTNIDYQALIDDFGSFIFTQSYEIAKKKGLEKQIPYIRAICREKVQSDLLKNKQDSIPTSFSSSRNPWDSFLQWAKIHLTAQTFSSLSQLSPILDGKSLLIQHPATEFSKQVIIKYFSEKQPDYVLLFSEPFQENNRIK